MAELLHEGLRDALSTSLAPQAICMKETANLFLQCSGGSLASKFTEQFVKFDFTLCEKLRSCINSAYSGNQENKIIRGSFHSLRTSEEIYGLWHNFCQHEIKQKSSTILLQNVTHYIFKELVKRCKY